MVAVQAVVCLGLPSQTGVHLRFSTEPLSNVRLEVCAATSVSPVRGVSTQFLSYFIFTFLGDFSGRFFGGREDVTPAAVPLQMGARGLRRAVLSAVARPLFGRLAALRWGLRR